MNIDENDGFFIKFVRNTFSFVANNLSKLKDPKARLRAILYGGGVAMFGLFLFAITLPATSNPKFCGLVCHSQKREYFTWKKSSHANITCTACHVEQGLIPFFHEKTVEGFLGLAAEFLGHETPINEESELGFEHISKDVCERCHNMKNRKVSPSRIFSEKMYGSGNKYHGKHLKKGIPCTVCHNRITHKDVNKPEIIKEAGWSKENEYDKKIIGKEYKDGMNMTEGCFRCHAPDPSKRDKHLVEKYRAQKAPKLCTNCHVASILPIGHKNNDWRSDHPKFAKNNIKYCLRCHNGNARFNFENKVYCTRCHAEHLVKKWI